VRDDETLLCRRWQSNSRESSGSDGLASIGRRVGHVGVHEFPQQSAIVGARDVDLVVDDGEDAVGLVFDQVQHVLRDGAGLDGG
jgi:hypothetical protein